MLCSSCFFSLSLIPSRRSDFLPLFASRPIFRLSSSSSAFNSSFHHLLLLLLLHPPNVLFIVRFVLARRSTDRPRRSRRFAEGIVSPLVARRLPHGKVRGTQGHVRGESACAQEIVLPMQLRRSRKSRSAPPARSHLPHSRVFFFFLFLCGLSSFTLVTNIYSAFCLDDVREIELYSLRNVRSAL